MGTSPSLSQTLSPPLILPSSYSHPLPSRSIRFSAFGPRIDFGSHFAPEQIIVILSSISELSLHHAYFSTTEHLGGIWAGQERSFLFFLLLHFFGIC